MEVKNLSFLSIYRLCYPYPYTSVWLCNEGKFLLTNALNQDKKNSMRKVVLDTQYKDEEEDDDDEEKNWKRGWILLQIHIYVYGSGILLFLYVWRGNRMEKYRKMTIFCIQNYGTPIECTHTHTDDRHTLTYQKYHHQFNPNALGRWCFYRLFVR